MRNSPPPRIREAGRTAECAVSHGCILLRPAAVVKDANGRKKDSRVNSSFGVAALVSLLPLVFEDNLSRQLPLQLAFPSLPTLPDPALPPPCCSFSKDAARIAMRSGATGARSLARSSVRSLTLRCWKEVCGATSATTRVQRVHRENHYAPRPERDSAAPRVVIFPRFLVIKISSRLDVLLSSPLFSSFLFSPRPLLIAAKRRSYFWNCRLIDTLVT